MLKNTKVCLLQKDNTRIFINISKSVHLIDSPFRSSFWSINTSLCLCIPVYHSYNFCILTSFASCSYVYVKICSTVATYEDDKVNLSAGREKASVEVMLCFLCRVDTARHPPLLRRVTHRYVRHTQPGVKIFFYEH